MNVSQGQKISEVDGYYFNLPEVFFSAQSRTRRFFRKTTHCSGPQKPYQHVVFLLQKASRIFQGSISVESRHGTTEICTTYGSKNILSLSFH